MPVKSSKIESNTWELNFKKITKNSPVSKEDLAKILNSLDPKSIELKKCGEMTQLAKDTSGQLWVFEFEMVMLVPENKEPDRYYRIISVKKKI